MNTKLYVGNLSYQTTENAIEDFFNQFGEVASVDLIMDRMTQRSRGFAFVTMKTPEDASKAIEGANGQSLDGRNLTVNEARPQTDRPKSFSGGGDYKGGGGGGGGRGDNRGGRDRRRY
jgi:cold-inducible RNA-binding protein